MCHALLLTVPATHPSLESATSATVPAGLDLLHTRLLMLATYVGARGGDRGVHAKEFSGRPQKRSHTARLTF